MKIAVSSTGKTLDSEIDPRFGRCAYFVIVETEDMSFEVFDNQNVALGGGAGIQSAQFIASKGAGAIITGNCGPNAMRTLSAAGVKVVVGQAGTVREAAERFKRGKLDPSANANVEAHYGSSMEAGTGMGRGMGGGGGRGMGMGRGRGGGARFNPPESKESATASSSSSKAEEIQALKKQAQDLMREIQDVRQRIAGLEKGQ